MSSILQELPNGWKAIRALILFLVFLFINPAFVIFVLFKIKISNFNGSIPRVSSSTSKKIGLALQYNIALTLAIKPSEGTITSSSTPTLFEIKPRCNALVALLSGTQNLTLHIFFILFENLSETLP